MKTLTLTIILILTTAIILSSAIIYKAGYSADCGGYECGELGGLIALLVSLVTWIFIIGGLIHITIINKQKIEIEDE